MTKIRSTLADEVIPVLSGLNIYKTPAFTGTTTNVISLSSFQLPKGKFLIFSNGYVSKYDGSLRNSSGVVGYISDLKILNNPILQSYTVYSPTTEAITWSNYQVVAIKIG